MKSKLIIATVGVFLVLTLSGCNSESVPKGKVLQTPIEFSSAVETKSSVTTPYTVIGYQTPDAFLTNWQVQPLFVQNFMADGTGTSNDKYYYDQVSYYDFVSFTPQSDAVNVISSVNSKTDAVTPVITFETPVNADIDLMSGKSQVEKISNTPVLIKFRHALTKVGFSAMQDPEVSDTYVITKLSITVNNDLATLDLTCDGTINHQTAAGSSATYDLGTVNHTLTTSFTDVMGERSHFYLVPQQLTSDIAKIEITYLNVTSGQQIERVFEPTTLLESGKHVTYQLIIGPRHQITFTYDIEPWIDASDGNGSIEIIK